MSIDHPREAVEAYNEDFEDRMNARTVPLMVPLCHCIELYGSHHPECPVTLEIHRIRGTLRALLFAVDTVDWDAHDGFEFGRLDDARAVARHVLQEFAPRTGGPVDFPPEKQL